MTEGLLVVVLLATAAVITLGIVATYRGFRADGHAPVDTRPTHAKSNPHDAATTAQLKRFFDAKNCAECGRPIPAPHVGDNLRPGLLNTSTRESIAWNDIPAANLSETFESHVAICSNCVIMERFSRKHAELVVDRHRTTQYGAP